MKIPWQKILIILLLLHTTPLWSIENVSPDSVHARLVRGDTLIILDVREVLEYQEEHIAEPEGQLPLTPVNMPYIGGVLTVEYDRLPRDVDIIVHCHSGGRSAPAYAFLETQGFTRIYNMTGGILAWTFETRKEGYGDHSGKWIHLDDEQPVSIPCVAGNDTSTIVFPSEAVPQDDSVYIELHFASSGFPIPQDVPQSELNGLFRITALDPFGLSMFDGDSLVLSDTISIDLIPKYPPLKPHFTIPSANENLTVHVPGEGWRSVLFTYDGLTFHRTETILRRWYNAEGSEYTGILSQTQSKEIDIQIYPNPFNDAVNIITPTDALITIYDIRGRLIHESKEHVWSPDKFVESGIYLVRVQFERKNHVRRVVYLK